MADPVIMAANEQFKSISRTLLQLGAALLIAAVVRIYPADSFSLETGAWIIVASGLIWLGLKTLERLESET